MIGLERGRVKLVPYATQWRQLFEEEKARLLEAVGDHVLDIQHVGSTSIPGMAAKPIIDIAIAVEDFDPATICVKPIEDLGYVYRGEHGIPRRHYFVKGDSRTHHIHMLEASSQDWETMLLFRDYLIHHPEMAQAYLELKQQLAQRFQADREAYTDNKDPFIQQVLQLARAERARFEALPILSQQRRWHEQAYPVASVLAIIRRDAVSERATAAPHYLLIQRQTEPYIGKWALVGGRWEFGETLESAIRREVKEETGLDTTFVALRGVINERIAPLGEEDDGAHFLLFVCELAAPTGTAHEQSEGPVEWFDSHHLAQLGTCQEIIATDYTILQRFTQAATPMTYIEADVIAQGGPGGSGLLSRFEITGANE